MKRSAVDCELANAPSERAMTLDRDETKYVIHPLRVHGMLRVLETQLRSHRYTGQGANRLPDAQHYTTTVYYDTPARTLYRAARDNPEHNEKLRARVYYDLHSSLAELATSAEQFVRRDPSVFLELKRREKTRTSKHRLRLETRELTQFLQEGRGGEAGPIEERTALLAFCARHEGLRPSCVVSYRRLSFEDNDGGLRVTLDLDVGFFVAPADHAQTQHALTHGTFGKPVGKAPMCLLEVKLRREQPLWLSCALEDTGARRESFSKFNLASEAVYGAR